MTHVKVNNRPMVKTWNGLVNELFNEFGHSFPATAANNTNLPPVNVVETNEGYHAELLAAGRKKELFSIKVENNQLVVSYQEEKTANPTEFKTLRNEFNISNFKRSFSLDEKMNVAEIQAKYEDGLLKLFIPKKPELQPAIHSINVQ